MPPAAAGRSAIDWIGFHLALLLLLAIELFYARRQIRLQRSPRGTAVAATAFWIAAVSSVLPSPTAPKSRTVLG